MTYSMTGFGRVEFTVEGRQVSIEIKCLNSKQQDVTVRVPGKLKSKELVIRNLLIEQLHRGKIELYLNYEQSASAGSKINPEAFKAYLDQLKEITGEESSEEMKAAVLKLPEVLSSEKEVLDEGEWTLIEEKLHECIEAVSAFRAAEGDNLKKDLLHRASSIADKLELIKEKDVERRARIKERLKSSISELEESLVDKNRFEQELIFYLEKLDITEEKVRLKSHLDFFDENLNAEGSKGKKLGFISQEIGREINTIGSKANDSEMQKTVVEMKDELEKIKEQLLNIL